MSHIQDQNRVAGQRKSNGDRNRVRRAYPSSERWFKQRMKDYRRKSRVDFKCEWSSRHNAMRKVHRQRELSDLNQCYRRHYSDNPWVGKTSTEIQQQYWEHKCEYSLRENQKLLGEKLCWVIFFISLSDLFTQAREHSQNNRSFHLMCRVDCQNKSKCHADEMTGLLDVCRPNDKTPDWWQRNEIKTINQKLISQKSVKEACPNTMQ